MHFVSVRVRDDNLMYLFFDDAVAVSVDAFDPRAIVHALGCDFARQQYTAAEIMALAQTRPPRALAYALTTHGHIDHAGGNPALRSLRPDTVFVSRQTSCSELQAGIFTVRSLPTPCHTRDSVSFLVTANDGQGCSPDPRGCGEDQEYGAAPVFRARTYLLTGDFLFRLGCGKFFEGTARDFLGSLDTVLNSCADSTLLLYGHDYNSTNRRFASKFFTGLPAEFFLRLSQEKKYNPFMNYAETGIPGSPEEVVGELRRQKDAFQ